MCPRPQLPDPRLLLEPIDFTPMEERAYSDPEALVITTKNNQAFETNRRLFKELQVWIKARPQY